MRLSTIIVPALLLTACVNIPKTTPPPIIVAPDAVCPLRVEYTQEQQNAIAAAVAALPTNSPLIGALADYHAMRQADLACLATK